MDYPFWDVAIGGGMLMGLVAVAHVVVSHFAIGGGLVIAVTETLAVRRGDRDMRELARRSSLMLILVSTVFGAISGVGIWVVAGLISPATISALIRNYVWGWAIEWTFFFVEIVAALVYYATWDRVSKKVHVLVGWIYFVAAYLSLVVINGIITFMLTPGQWLESGAFWDGFFNPTYWPSLLLRTGIAMIMATAFMLFPALKGAVTAWPRLVRYLGWWLLAGVLVAYGGYRWWEAALPESVRAMFLGGDAATLTALADTRPFLLWSLAAVLVLCVVFLLAAPRQVRRVTAVAIMIGAFAFFGGYERLREGVRKPFLIHDYMFSNGLRVADIGTINENGLAATSGWVARAPEDDEVARGRQIFRAQCASCHTLNGYQGVRELLPDPDLAFAVIYTLYEQGEAYVSADPAAPPDKTTLDYPFMPPFVGTEEEMAALAAYLGEVVSGEDETAGKGGH
jgi:mono/diheme cytochrome c family protein